MIPPRAVCPDCGWEGGRWDMVERPTGWRRFELLCPECRGFMGSGAYFRPHWWHRWTRRV